MMLAAVLALIIVAAVAVATILLRHHAVIIVHKEDQAVPDMLTRLDAAEKAIADLKAENDDLKAQIASHADAASTFATSDDVAAVAKRVDAVDAVIGLNGDGTPLSAGGAPTGDGSAVALPLPPTESTLIPNDTTLPPPTPAPAPADAVTYG